MLTLTKKAHEAVVAISRPTGAAYLPGLRICRRTDRPAFSVKRVVSPEESDRIVEHAGARVFLGPIAARRFSDSVLDVRTDALGRLQFVVRDAT